MTKDDERFAERVAVEFKRAVAAMPPHALYALTIWAGQAFEGGDPARSANAVFGIIALANMHPELAALAKLLSDEIVRGKVVAMRQAIAEPSA